MSPDGTLVPLPFRDHSKISIFQAARSINFGPARVQGRADLNGPALKIPLFSACVVVAGEGSLQDSDLEQTLTVHAPPTNFDLMHQRGGCFEKLSGQTSRNNNGRPLVCVVHTRRGWFHSVNIRCLFS